MALLCVNQVLVLPPHLAAGGFCQEEIHGGIAVHDRQGRFQGLLPGLLCSNH